MPSRRPASVTSTPSKPPASTTRLDDDGAGEDQVGARGLDAGDAAALGGRHLGQPLDQVVEHVGAIT